MGDWKSSENYNNCFNLMNRNNQIQDDVPVHWYFDLIQLLILVIIIETLVAMIICTIYQISTWVYLFFQDYDEFLVILSKEWAVFKLGMQCGWYISLLVGVVYILVHYSRSPI